MYKKMGGGGIPITRVNGKDIIRGNNLSKIKNVLNLK